jgi:hypothetical protein
MRECCFCFKLLEKSREKMKSSLGYHKSNQLDAVLLCLIRLLAEARWRIWRLRLCRRPPLEAKWLRRSDDQRIRSCCHLGLSWGHIGPSWAVLGPSCAILECLGAILEHECRCTTPTSIIYLRRTICVGVDVHACVRVHIFYAQRLFCLLDGLAI